MNIIPKEAALDMLKHSALKRTNDFAEYWFFSAPSVVVTPNDGSKGFRCSLVDLVCFAYDLCKSNEPLPKHKHTSPELIQDSLYWFWPQADWEEPNKVFIKQVYIDQTVLELTLKEALCYAYNLKPNE